MTEPINFYLAVFRPKTVWTGNPTRVPPTGTASIQIDFMNGASVTGTYGLAINETVWFGSGTNQYDIGKARLRSYGVNTFNNATGTFTVGTNDDTTPYINTGTYITIKEEFRLWSIYPRAVEVGGVPFLWEDFDVGYNGDNHIFPPVAVAPPPAVKFLVNGSAVVNFTGDKSWQVDGHALSYLWTAEGSVEGTSTAQGTAGSPVQFTWTQAGTYIVSLEVVDTINGKAHTAYTNVYIFSKYSPELPNNGSYFTTFDSASMQGDWQRGGWDMSFTVYGHADKSYFPEGTQVVVFTDGNLTTRTATWPHRDNILFVGNITKGSVSADWQPRNPVKFTAATIDDQLRNLTFYSAIMYDVSTTPTNWTEVQGLNIPKLFRYLAVQRSTLAAVAPFLYFNFTRYVKTRDLGAGNIWSIFDTNAKACLANISCSAQGVVYTEVDYQLMLSQERTAITNRKSLDDTSWIDATEASELHNWARPVNSLKVDGVYYPGDGNADHQVPLFSLAPGFRSHDTGQMATRSGLLLANQPDLNARSGRLLAKMNNIYPNFTAQFVNEGSFDISPQETYTVTDANDRFSFNRIKMLPRRVSHTLSAKDGVLRSRVDFEPEVFGRSGTTFTMRVPQPTTSPNPNPPPSPISPPPIGTVPTQPPIIILAFGMSTSTIKVSWTISYGATSYVLERSPNGMGSWSTITTTTHPNVSFTDSGLAADTTYYYRCRARNNNGFTAYSNIKSGKTMAPALSGRRKPPKPLHTIPSRVFMVTGYSLSITDDFNSPEPIWRPTFGLPTLPNGSPMKWNFHQDYHDPNIIYAWPNVLHQNYQAFDSTYIDHKVYILNADARIWSVFIDSDSFSPMLKGYPKSPPDTDHSTVIAFGSDIKATNRYWLYLWSYYWNADDQLWYDTVDFVELRPTDPNVQNRIRVTPILTYQEKLQFGNVLSMQSSSNIFQGHTDSDPTHDSDSGNSFYLWLTDMYDPNTINANVREFFLFAESINHGASWTRENTYYYYLSGLPDNYNKNAIGWSAGTRTVTAATESNQRRFFTRSNYSYRSTIANLNLTNWIINSNTYLWYRHPNAVDFINVYGGYYYPPTMLNITTGIWMYNQEAQDNDYFQRVAFAEAFDTTGNTTGVYSVGRVFDVYNSAGTLFGLQTNYFDIMYHDGETNSHYLPLREAYLTGSSPSVVSAFLTGINYYTYSGKEWGPPNYTVLASSYTHPGTLILGYSVPRGNQILLTPYHPVFVMTTGTFVPKAGRGSEVMLTTPLTQGGNAASISQYYQTEAIVTFFFGYV